MQTLPPLTELLPYLPLLLLASASAGFLAGVFGIGGGAILVPVFYQLLSYLGIDEAIRMHIAVGTSLAVIVPTSLRSFLSHKARGSVNMPLLVRFGPYVPVGVVMASILSAYVSGGFLKVVFSVCSILIALKMFLARDDFKLGDDLPTGLASKFAGWAIGSLSTFMGIGGGVFTNTFMTSFGRPMHEAVATSAGVGVLISIPGVIGYIWAGWGVANLPDFSIGYINLLMLGLTIPVTLAMAPVGVKVAHLLSKRQLELGFAVFLTVVSVRFIADLIG